MKLGWKIATNARDMWCAMMQDKYDIQEELMFSREKIRVSSLWEGKPKVSKDIHFFDCWHVGDSMRIRVWQDNWLGEELRTNDIQHLIPDNLVGAKVVDLVNDQMEWSWNLLDGWLPLEWRDKI